MTIKKLRTIRRFIKEYREEKKLRHSFGKKSAELAGERFTCDWGDRRLCLSDATTSTGFDSHYLYHTAWAARCLAQSSPDRHVDIGSCLRFVTLVSAFIPVEFYDYRPAEISLSTFHSNHADITALPFGSDSIMSLSCMHVVEHIGLERYGDPFDPQGDLKAMAELSRVLAPGGNLFFVVPVGGIARIQYNAHRIYRYSDIVCNFPELSLQSFALITDTGLFYEHTSEQQANEQKYGCGCFWFSKM